MLVFLPRAPHMWTALILGHLPDILWLSLQLKIMWSTARHRTSKWCWRRKWPRPRLRWLHIARLPGDKRPWSITSVWITTPLRWLRRNMGRTGSQNSRKASWRYKSSTPIHTGREMTWKRTTNCWKTLIITWTVTWSGAVLRTRRLPLKNP